ncbi:albusnodin family lasso peptide [Nocardiopsis alborubida]|uniref:Albusnodin family lasso peptide n=1 Tax=Nocardiopsis alborubida TaxID=146802 RepID=A0A7X6M9V3_9ACTN|nr:albusnodin family lasso peptide [Nocardiopsis alborubida]NKY96148.1 albusnodin family lasso peptide [Nocardiopsis alborubida]
MDKPVQDSPDLGLELIVDLGDAADLTLGQGRAQNENKRNPYN